MLKTRLTTKNLTADNELKDYLEKRISKLNQLIDDDDTSAQADIELEKYGGQNKGEIFRAEINLQVAGAMLRAEEEAETIRKAIDATKEEMMRELRDRKEKQQTKERDGARKAKDMMRDGEQEADAEAVEDQV